jgi:hypothetical protein
MHMEDLEELDGDGEINHPPNDLMFDQWAALPDRIMPAIAPIMRQVLGVLGPAGRKARAELVDGIAAIVPAIIANLMLLHQERPEGSRLVIVMERRRKTRYDRPGFRKLPEVVRALEQTGHVVRHHGVYKKLRTTIEPTEPLKRLLAVPDVRLSEITRAAGEETIHLAARPVQRRIAGKKQPKLLIDYKDNEESLRLRSEMEGINRFLAQHSVTLEGRDLPDFRLFRRFALRHVDDPLNFDLHGRLYGGYWMNLKATERQHLRIDGEPIADLDFASMFPRLAYRHVGKEAPQGDLYAIPGLENHRDGAKAALSALLSYSAEMKSVPSRLKEQLPDGWTASRVKQAFATSHSDLVPLFGRDFGLDLMFTESRILLATFRRLMSQGIPALPMHDGIMIPTSKSDAGKAAMEEASVEIVGTMLPVLRKA